jgi:hypothetical protein
VLLFFPFSIFEALHSYIFSTAHSTTTLLAFSELGQYCSAAVMLALAAVFFFRLNFILSPEGRFYENLDAGSAWLRGSRGYPFRSYDRDALSPKKLPTFIFCPIGTICL